MNGARCTRLRRLACAIAGAVIAAAASPPAALAGWSHGPTQIRSTAETIQPIAACSDGAFGAIVAWQESTHTQGRLRAQHVTATGDNDPAWPVDGALVCGAVLSRTSLEVFPDGAGGAYLLWVEPGAVKVVRLDAGGNTAPGWPACGLAIGAGTFPVGLADGTGGLFVAWTRSQPGPDTGIPVLQRLDANGVAPGWPATGRPLHEPDPVATIDLWLRLAPGPGGDVYASWVTISLDSLTVPNAVWITRRTSGGEAAVGWPDSGVALEPYRWDSPGVQIDIPPIDMVPDGRGGVFHIVESPYVWVAPPPNEHISATYLNVRLRRVQPDGTPAPGWPEDGMLVSNEAQLPCCTPDEGPHLVYDDDDGVFVGIATYASEGYRATSYWHWTDAGLGAHFGTAEPLDGKSVVKSPGGGLFLGSFEPNGPYGYWSPNAKLHVIQCPALPGWSDFLEFHTEYGSSWFGDIALVPTGDGGAIFFWSQHNTIFGLFARRFSGSGQVVGVPDPGGAGHPVRAWFAQGTGVRAAGSTGDTGMAHLELFDLSGRRTADLRLAAPGAFDVALPGTARLGAGIYFLRIRTGAEVLKVRVAVIP